MATQRDESRKEWEGNQTIHTITAGSLQRIADATELMAKNYVQLQNECNRYVRWYEDAVDTSHRLQRQNAALRGVITRIKNKQKEGA